MIARTRFFSSALALLTMGGVAALAPLATAAAPAAPTNLAVDITRARDSDYSVNYTSFRLTWVDNAFDEEGYIVDARLNGAGEFIQVQRLGPNTQSAVVSLPTFAKDNVIEFRLGAFKFSGATVIHDSVRPVVKYTVVDGTAPDLLAAPSALTKEIIDDGTIKLKWNDTNTNEMYYQILFKKSDDTAYSLMGYLYFNTTEYTFQKGLVPGATYSFTVRATRQAPSDGNTFTNEKFVGPTATAVDVKIPDLSKPTELTATASSETAVKLTWKDNSKNETAYQVEYKLGSATEFTTLGTVAANTTTLSVPTPPSTTTVWRVRAIYKTTTVTTAILSAASNEVTVNTTFTGPTDLVATTSGHAGAVELTWKDNSDAEATYEIYTRPVGSTGEFALAMSVPADTVKATIKTRSSSGTTVALELDTDHEFKVKGRYPSSTADLYTPDSNIAHAKAMVGFISRFYWPASVGAVFSYAILTSSGRTDWTVNSAQLPPGLTFNAATGIVSGVPSAAGVYVSHMTATFANAHVAEADLTIRVLRAATAPTVIKNIPSVTIAPGTVFSISLADKFSDNDSEQAVHLDTTLGPIDIMLYPSLAPEGVANFLGYVNAGSYDGVSFHRSIPNFVIQGGGFKPVSAPRTFQSVTPRPSPKNEPGISNVRGTLSAAKLGNNPDSATHDFFINLGNNNDADNADSLDNQNGGFTVFGRVAGTGMTIVDSIAALPTRGYVDNNDYTVASPVYDASLDKRIIVDGSAASFQDFPINVSGSAPVDMDVTKTVRINTARQISPVTYSVSGNVPAGIVEATVSGSVVTLKGLAQGDCTVTVQMADIDGHSTPTSFAVHVAPGYKGPAITKHPVSVAVATGAKATLSVTATGTSLQYQWRKDGTLINGANSPSLVLSNISSANVGAYDVIVGNATTSILSNSARVDLKAGADITVNPVSRLIKVGDELNLSVTVTGAPAPAIVWTRDGKTVTGQTKPALVIKPATLKEAGVYKATATNASGPKDISGEVKVCVTDPLTVPTAAKAGTKVTLTAGVAGPFTSYQWLKNDIAMDADSPTDTRISGTKTKTLVFTTVNPTDTASYTCQVVAPDGLGTATSGIQKLAVVTKPIIAAFTANNGVVGYDYDYTLPYDTAADKLPTTFGAANLPLGLAIDTKTGRITGRARVAGIYKISASVSNVMGTSSAIGTLNILPMSQANVGNFVGVIGPADLNGNLGGRLDLIMSDNGTYSGKVTLNADAYSFAGGLTTYVPGAINAQGQIIIPRKGSTPILLAFVMDESYGNLTGQVTDGVSTAAINGFRQYWISTWRPSPYGGTYNMALNLASGDVGTSATIPQGTGYISMSANANGYNYMTGSLADGSSFTVSSVVGAGGQFMIFNSLYKKTGSVVGTASFGDTNLSTNPAEMLLRVDGSLRWAKNAQSLATERTYKAGIGAVTLQILGSTYIPGAGGRIMGLPGVPNNARMVFTGGGLTASVVNPDVPHLTVLANNTAQFPSATNADNPGKVKLTTSNAVGLFNGSFELSGTTEPKRTVTFKGMVIPKIPATPGTPATTTTSAVAEIPGSDGSASGFFLLNQLPTASPPTTLLTSPILSGKVEIKPVGISFSQQALVVVTGDLEHAPQASLAVNAGTNVTFSVTVSPDSQGTFTYQWKKDSYNISGATESTYKLENVAEAAQGSYTVVVSNGAVSLTSAAAVLNINDPLTSVVVTRTPSAPSVSPNATVTFTPTIVGSGPFTYQWIKDGANITNATNATYIIPTATNSDVGAYAVKVTTPLTPAGITSAAINLAVGDPVSQVVASRTPSTTPVGTGQTITFTVAALGSGNLSYQWSKDGSAISGATSKDYVINSSTAENNGSYTVLVSNPTTPAGVTSNAVTLTVTDAVANVVASRDPSTGILAEGMSVTFSVTAVGGGTLSYQWRKNGTPITTANNSTYTIASAALADAGDYDVVVSNATTPGGVASNVLHVGVGTPVTNVNASRTPLDDQITGGTSVVFTVTAQGSEPFTYQWRRNSVDIVGATSSILSLNSVTAADAGDYDVTVSNPASSGGNAVHSNLVPLQVLDVVRNVKATRTPNDATLSVGTQVTFTATAEGGGLTYQWRKDGVNIANAVSATYVRVLGTGDTATYDCVVKNSITTGGVASNGLGVVVATPVDNVIATVQPGTNVATGTNLVFSVTATGSLPRTYQWRKDSAIIPGATGDTYTINAAGIGDSGIYDVIVGNAVSSGGNAVPSGTLNVTVNP